MNVARAQRGTGRQPTRRPAGFSSAAGGTSGGATQVIAEHLAAGGGRTVRQWRGPPPRFVAGWAALGITLSGATQLRMAGLPVGASELILAAWIAFIVFLLLRGAKIAPGRVFVMLGGYWLGALMLLAFGTLVAVQSRRADLDGVIHDGVAFVYVAALTTFLALRLFEDDHQYHWHFARMTFLFHGLAAAVLLGLAYTAPMLGPIHFWYGGGLRFRGWAENPNQMALAMIAMPFLGWWLMRRTSGLFGKAACALGIAACVMAAIATKSDSLRVGWVAGFGVIGGLLFYRVMARGRSRWLHVSHVIIPALVVVVGIFYGDALVEHLTHVAEGVYSERDQGEKRFTLWFHGIEVIAASPLFGFGPGSYSGYGGPFESKEAHNTFIDWGMSTGLLGVLLYFALLGWCLWRALRSGELMLVGMAISVIVFSLFGYVLRQPDFWMIVVLVLMMSERAIALRERQAGEYPLEPGARSAMAGPDSNHVR